MPSALGAYPMNHANYAPVPGFDGYRVEADGSVWSCRTRTKRGAGNGRGCAPGTGTSWHRVKATPVGKGYLRVTLRRDGESINELVHRLVLLAFVGPCPDGMEGCHKDGNRANNRRDNLRWDTPESNWTDRLQHGRGCDGEKNPGAKITADDVRSIRRRVAAGERQTTLMAEYRLSRAGVNNIVNRRSWATLTDESEASNGGA